MKFTLFALNVLFVLGLGAQDFQFKYTKGELFRYEGTNEQQIVLNGERSRQTTILSQVAFTVLDVRDGSGYLKGSVRFLEPMPAYQGLGYKLEELPYPAEFWRDTRGLYTIKPEFLVPVVRHVPRFPDKVLKPGDTWSFPGEEVHDMRQEFGLSTPLRVPMTVFYQYTGDREWGGKTYKEIKVSYDIFARTGFTSGPKGYFPVRMSGSSRQTLLWDLEAGRPQAYQEEYALYLHLNTGDVYEFTGRADSQYVAASPLDRDETVRQLRQSLDDQGLKEVDVKSVEKGVALNAGLIQFRADSDVILPGQEEKLAVLAAVLKEFPERNILVEGHTAAAGTEQQQQALSERRARALMEKMIELGVRPQGQIQYRGWGARVPLAPNTTEEGRQRNRRVEITILEN